MGRLVETDNKLDTPGNVVANVVGLTGDLALQGLSRRAKKKANEERKKEEEERMALMERIFKAK